MWLEWLKQMIMFPDSKVKQFDWFYFADHVYVHDIYKTGNEKFDVKCLQLNQNSSLFISNLSLKLYF